MLNLDNFSSKLFLVTKLISIKAFKLQHIQTLLLYTVDSILIKLDLVKKLHIDLYNEFLNQLN